ncbi:small nuclear ribonucleoprotein [Coccidioides immitis RMSCC 3703]|uniref:Small nuclear ribonucleoprotein n=1 Tax=Coccidioides immitis RMSCC 3703 TaxID=454286 RepID=A0A0J8QSG3_COCIT|nr:small nuclear ribonucleoprotein [Coccidioides immitis RMSCC 3703]
MAAEQRKLLEQLMGADQLIGTGASARNAQLSITDPKVCRSYLVGTCPHDLFTNTKQDLGPCPKVHSEGLKAEYEAASSHEKSKWGFEYDYMRDMQKYIDECNRRIDSAQRRLEKTPDEIRQTNNLLRQISDLSKTINTGLEETAILASSDVYRSQSRNFTDQTSNTREALKGLKPFDTRPLTSKLKYATRLDNDRRLADHFFGKMHLGYAKMRETYSTLQKELRGPPPSRHEDGPSGRDSGYEDGGWGPRPGGGYGGRSYRSGGGGGGYGRRRGGGYGSRW